MAFNILVRVKSSASNPTKVSPNALQFGGHTFCYQHVCEDPPQSEVYAHASPLVTGLFQGTNSSVLCFGAAK